MTATDPIFAGLSEKQRRKLESWLVAFDRRWNEGRLAAAAAKLPRDHPLRRVALAEMLKIDVERRWQRGTPLPLEDYLRALPELGTPETVSVDLILAEYEARRMAGQTPALSEFAARFPGRAEELQRRLQQAPPASGQTAAWSTVNPGPSTPTPAPGGPVPAGPALAGQFGRYRIVRPLGRGGMGTVYLAHDTQLDREVALKVPRFAEDDGPDVVERFYREARAAAALRHPHVCPVYDVGAIDGIHYLTMAYIDGRSLADLIADGPRPQDEAAGLARRLARALEFTHRHGIIHRDLKPANVLLDKNGEPAITDFGLARRVNKAEARLTQSGALLGTPAYMAPEQAAGHVEAVGPAADVYSLGVILYELLTGQLPFRGSVVSVLAQAVGAEPERPSSLRPDLNPQLEAIVMKAMAKKVTDRYGSTSELAGALDDYLAVPRPVNRIAPILAKRAAVTQPGPQKKGPRPGRRWRWLAAAVAALVTVLGVGLWLASGPPGPRDDKAPPPDSSGGGSPRAVTDPRKDPAAPQEPGPPPESSQKDPVAFDLPKPLAIKGHTNGVNAVAFSPDSKLLATGSADKTIRLWDVASAERKERIPHVTAILCLAFAPDGKTLAAGDAEGKVTFWNVGDGEKRAGFTANGEHSISLLAYAPDGKTLATVPYRSHEVDLWDVERQKVRTTLKGHRDLVMAVAFSPDGTTVATTGYDSTIRLWDGVTGKEKDSLRAHDGAICSLAFLKDGRLLSAGKDHTVIVWDVKKGNVVKPVIELPPSYHREVQKVFATPEGRVLSQTEGWDLDVSRPGSPRPFYHRKGYEPTGVVVARVDFSTDYHNRTTLSPDGKTLAGVDGQEVFLYDLSPYTAPAK
jgi:serine/threonine protein kinase